MIASIRLNGRKVLRGLYEIDKYMCDLTILEVGKGQAVTAI